MCPDAFYGEPPHDRPADHKRRPRYPGTHPRRYEHRYKELDPESHPGILEHVLAQGRTPAGTHVPVMLSEVLDALQPRENDIIIDCTLGYGGHAHALLDRLGPTGRLIGLDVDAAQLARTAERLRAPVYPQADGSNPVAPPRIRLHRSHFAGIGKVLAREQLDGCDCLLADLGASSMQVDDPARGFSYKYDAPLDMRMDDRLVRTAADLLQSLSQEDLSVALDTLADEPDHERIASAIVERRSVEPITRCRQLTRLVLAAKERGSRRPTTENDISGRRHPAARVFQALRMMVNDELNGLEQLLRAAPYCLRPGGRVCVISFHSGEHERVERAFANGVRGDLYGTTASEAILPTAQERYDNARSRSAQLRWAIRAVS